ncbi:MAG: hypothetical protein PHH54_06345 [Candidatus Nanoarchaeia archaeon]|nr:hypothetical protein [Candidatus Nanoarchaeia archaeon]MDD5741575.1 hypothetical protein [Candidatus Nanoarchaeia archaeon]
MNKKYISFDIEASGPTPGKYSMLSLGACIVGDNSVQFYREIKPISRNFITSAMRVSSKGLRCLDNLRHVDEFNPKSDKFDPCKVLDILNEKGDEPQKVMEEYAGWVIKYTVGFRPVEAAAPIKFDGMFTAWYFDNFYDKENPFGHSGEDINSMLRGVIRNVDAHVAQFGLRGDDLPHNALEDAVVQAKEFEKVLDLLAY